MHAMHTVVTVYMHTYTCAWVPQPPASQPASQPAAAHVLYCTVHTHVYAACLPTYVSPYLPRRCKRTNRARPRKAPLSSLARSHAGVGVGALQPPWPWLCLWLPLAGRCCLLRRCAVLCCDRQVCTYVHTYVCMYSLPIWSIRTCMQRDLG
ncbi:hypothetical protein BKA80DRAFT_31240 [Phyllosticta citrichinensis]